MRSLSPRRLFNSVKEFVDGTKKANGQILRHFLKAEHRVEGLHRLGKHLSFRQRLNSFGDIGDTTGACCSLDEPLRFDSGWRSS